MAGSGSLDLAAALLAQGFGGPEQPAATSTGPTAPVPATAAAPAPAPTPAAGPVAAPAAPVAAIPTTPKAEPEPFDRQPGRVKHVFMISLTSPSGYEKSFGTTSEMPYLSQTLRPQGQLLSNYSLISAKGLPNYIAMTSGQRPNGQTSLDCPSYNLFAPSAGPNKKGFVAGDGCLYPLTMTSFPDQLLPERLKWRAYMEDMANPDSPDPATAPTPPKVPTCVRPTVNQPDTTQRSRQGNGYAARHNPFVYYRSLVDLGECVPNVLALRQARAPTSGPHRVFPDEQVWPPRPQRVEEAGISTQPFPAVTAAPLPRSPATVTRRPLTVPAPALTAAPAPRDRPARRSSPRPPRRRPRPGGAVRHSGSAPRS